MSRKLLCLVLAACMTVQCGCGRLGPAARKAAQKGVKGLVQGAKRAPKKPADVKKLLPAARTATRTLAETAGHALSHSAKVGSRLTALRSRIPAVVYSRLYQQWQQNDTQIRANMQELESPYISSARRKTLMEEIDHLAAKNAEIERLAEQYG